ncbi:hypothetical protein Tco_0958281 [Tanacetum coccineum]
MDICPRVKGEEFTKVQDDDATLTFLTDLGYKGLLHKYTNMYVDHMHQPWRTLATIINKCLSRKTPSNDRLRKSRIDIMWGMMERKSRRETMPFPRFTKVIINHFLKQHKSLSNLKYQHYHTIKDDGIVSRLKFIIIGEDYQEYGLAIPDMMLNDAIKQSKSYQMFIKYSTDTPVADVDVSDESDSEPTRKRTASRRVVKKKVTISTVDNIIPDPDVALELGKSISLTEPAEEEAARQVHATHARIVTESETAKKKTSSRRTREQEATDIMQTLTESKKTSRRQPGTRGSSEGTDSEYSEEDQGNDEEVDWIDSNEDEEKKDDTDDDKIIDLEMTDDEETNDEFVHGVEQVNDDEDEEMTNAEVEEFGNGDEENIDSEKTDARKTEEVKDDAKKAELPLTSSNLSVSSDAEINLLLYIKIQSEVPYIQSPSVLTVSISMISEPVVPTPIPVTPLVAPATSLLTPLSFSTIPLVPHQTTTPLPIPPIITDALTITIDVPESDGLSAVQLRVARLEKFVFELKKIDHSARALATLKSQVLTRHTADLIQKYSVKPAPESSKIQTPTINLEQEYEKSALEILEIKKEQAEKQKMPKYTIKSTDKAALKEYDQKSALYQTMHKNKSFNKNPTNHILYHALMEALIEDENAMDKGVANTVKDHKRKHDDDDDEDPPAGPNQGKKTKRRRTKESESSKKPSTTKETSKGKAPSKGSKTGKSASLKELVEEPIAEVAMDDAGEDVVRDDDQPQDTSEPKTVKTPNPEWFKQPPRPPTHDPE